MEKGLVAGRLREYTRTKKDNEEISRSGKEFGRSKPDEPFRERGESGQTPVKFGKLKTIQL